jgi:hypothetical protein
MSDLVREPPCFSGPRAPACRRRTSFPDQAVAQSGSGKVEGFALRPLRLRQCGHRGRPQRD